MKIIGHPQEVKVEDLIEAYQVIHDLGYEVELTPQQQFQLNAFIEQGLVVTEPFVPRPFEGTPI